MTRKYLLTVAQLVDRLSIVNLKSIKIHENKKEYEKEAQEIMHDISRLLKKKDKGQFIRAIQINQLVNELIWSNESKARQGSSEQNHLLKLTHSLNRIRNQAMNVISHILGERKDLKLDYLDASLTQQFGYNFDDIFGEKANEFKDG